MPDFLTRRSGSWHFVRRVPIEFAAFYPRGIVKHSTKTRISDDRNGGGAARVADQLNRNLDAQWRSLAGGVCDQQASRYEQARTSFSSKVIVPDLNNAATSTTFMFGGAFAANKSDDLPAQCAECIGSIWRMRAYED